MDIGSGGCSCIAKLCQLCECRGFGIEYDSGRVIKAAHQMKKVIEEQKHNKKFLVGNIFNCHQDVTKINQLPSMVTVVYMFDEAFNPELMQHIFQVIAKSKSIKYVISFKSGRCLNFNTLLVEATGMQPIANRVSVSKSHSGGKSSYAIYSNRNKIMPSELENCSLANELESKATSFFQLSHDDQINFYQKQVETLELEKEKDMENRKFIMDIKRK